MADFMGLIIEVVLAVVLFPVLTSFIADATVNQTGAVVTLLNLIPILYVIVIAFVVYRTVRSKER